MGLAISFHSGIVFFFWSPVRSFPLRRRGDTHIHAHTRALSLSPHISSVPASCRSTAADPQP